MTRGRRNSVCAGHPNVVTLRDVILCTAGEGRGLYLVFDWAEFELSEILKTHRDKKEGLDEKGVKSIMWQILNGIAFLHQNWVRGARACIAHTAFFFVCSRQTACRTRLSAQAGF